MADPLDDPAIELPQKNLTPTEVYDEPFEGMTSPGAWDRQPTAIQLARGEPLSFDLKTPDSCLECISRYQWSQANGECDAQTARTAIEAASKAARIHDQLKTPSLAESALLRFAQDFPRGPSDPAWRSVETKTRQHVDYAVRRMSPDAPSDKRA